MTTPYDEFIGWMSNQKEAVTAEKPEPELTPLERAKELRLKHLAGQHDQSAHGHGGGGFDADSFVAEITKLPVSERITRMKKLSPQERDAVTAAMSKRSGIVSTPKKPEKITLRREREPHVKSGYVWRAYGADGRALGIGREDIDEVKKLVESNTPVSEFVNV